jgi:hypothetical protein
MDLPIANRRGYLVVVQLAVRRLSKCFPDHACVFGVES